MSNKVRVKWGALHNFKCVDYFLVEYFNKGEVDSEKILTPRIERFKRFFDIDVDPCTEYAVKACGQFYSSIILFYFDKDPKSITLIGSAYYI